VVAVVILLRGALLPFVTGMAVAYLLSPGAGRIEHLGVGRLAATLVIMGSVVVTIVIFGVLTLPAIVNEILHFVENVPRYVRTLQALATDPDRPWFSKIVGEGLREAEHSLGEFTALASSSLDTFLRSIWSGGKALISVFSLAIVAPIVACYLIYHWNRMIAAIDRLIPPGRRETARALASEIDKAIAAFVRGQSLLCVVLTVFYASALWLIGLEHSVLIGIASGLLSFIPYVGFLTGLVIATCIAIAQFWPDWRGILFVPVIFLLGQSLSDYVLAPYLVGRRVHLNPVWMMLALFAFGYLFGLVGLLVAGPLAAAISVLMRFAVRQYYASPLYSGAASPAPVQKDR
jgi:predicted PurR-regulated permease PerM